MEAPVSSTRRIAGWLFIVALAIYAMVVVGGATRLTGSGLSITEWQPILGVIPPLNKQAWQHAFDLYQQYPQYRIVNLGMTLSEFKGIYYWEYFHRLLGRAIGVIYFLPFLYFLFTRQLPRRFMPHLLMILLLGAAQGFMGWFMVKSGLVDKPWVSPYRLTVHLLLALLVYSYVLWQALALWGTRRELPEETGEWVRNGPWVLLLVLVGQICYGGFVAGLKAALTYATFPKMNGQWIPSGLLRQQPLWANFFENHTTTQFIHRGLAFLLVVTVLLYWWYARRERRLRDGAYALLAVLLLQFALGIGTVMNSVGHVPMALGVLHQAGAVLLLSVVLYLLYSTRRPAEGYDRCGC